MKCEGRRCLIVYIGEELIKILEQDRSCHLSQAGLPGQELCQLRIELCKAAADVICMSLLGLRNCSSLAKCARLEACDRAVL